MQNKPEEHVISADDIAGTDKGWLDHLVQKHATGAGQGLEQIFAKYDALHAQDMERHRASFDDRMKVLDLEIAAIREKTKEPEPQVPVLKKDPFAEKVDEVLNRREMKEQFRDRAVANFPGKLEEQVEPFKDEIREVDAMVKAGGISETKLLVHLADTDGMRRSRNFDIAHKASFILYTAARQNGGQMSMAAGMFSDILNNDHSVKQISSFNSTFSWFSKRSTETLDKMLSAQKSLLDKAGDPAGYSHIIFVADNTLKTGDAAFCAETIRDMSARHPNVKWDIVLLSAGEGREGSLANVADMFPDMRFTEVRDINKLPQALAQIAVTPFGVPVSLVEEGALKTQNLLLRHSGP